MRHTIVIDMTNNCEQVCTSSVAEDENTVNFVFYTTNATNIKITISGESLEEDYIISGFAANSICFAAIPTTLYPTDEGELYVIFSDSTQTSDTITLHFNADNGGYMFMSKDPVLVDTYNLYYLTFKTLEEISDEIDNLSTDITTSGSDLNNAVRSVAAEASVNIGGSFTIEDIVQTNINKYFLKADASYNKATKTVTWNSQNWLFTNGTPSTFVRHHTKIEGSTIDLMEITYLEAASSYSETNTQQFKINNGQQVYYTAIGSDSEAYKSLMLTTPSSIYGSNVDNKAFEVRIPTTTSSKIIAAWEWELQNNEHVPIIRMGAGNINGNGKASIQTQFSGTSFLQSGQFDGANRGIKILDDGVYYSNDGDNWIKLGNTESEGAGSTSGSYVGGQVSIIDHTPTTDDLTGDYGVIVQYDSSSTPVITGAKGTLYNASNVYIEVPSVSEVTIDPESPTVYTGRTQQFTGYINGTAQQASEFTWSVEGNTSNSTEINNGLLTVGNDEEATTIQIKATSTANPNKYGATTATVEEAPTSILYDSGTFNNPMDSQLYSGVNSGLTLKATELVKSATISDGFIQLWFSEKVNTALFNHFNVTFTYTGNYPNNIFIGYCHADTIPTGAPSGTNSNMNAPKPTSGEEMTQTLTLVNYGECYIGLAMWLHTANSGYMKIQIKKIWVD